MLQNTELGNHDEHLLPLLKKPVKERDSLYIYQGQSRKNCIIDWQVQIIFDVISKLESSQLVFHFLKSMFPLVLSYIYSPLLNKGHNFDNLEIGSVSMINFQFQNSSL